MKKGFYRIAVTSFALIIFSYGYLTIFFDELGLYNDYIDPSLYLSLSLFIVSLFLFFVSNTVFKKWLGFAVLWILLSILIIVPAPTHSGGLITGFQFTKENYSVFMSVLFVPISLGILLFASWKERKSKDR